MAMGTSGARLGRWSSAAIVVVAIVVAACGSSAAAEPTGLIGITGQGGTGDGAGGQPSGDGSGGFGAPSNAPVAGVPSTGPGSMPTSTPRPTAKPTPAPKPKPTACRGVIPTSFAALQGPLHHPVGPTTTASLWYVVDGDTIRLSNGDYVRLIGMDTPETVKPGTPVQPYGPQASADLKRMLAGRSSVVLEKDVSNTDYYGRLLRFVWIRSGNSWFQLDYELVVRGDARIDTFPPDVRYEANYAAAERIAQAHHVGRWATC